MNTADNQLRVVDVDKTAFTVWLGRSLKSSHEDAIHEPIPSELLALLPPTTQR